jgi:hypothetical protein
MVVNFYYFQLQKKTMKEKIRELFLMLSRADQLELLRELTSSTEINNPVVEVLKISQELYGKNVTFNISNVGSPLEPVILAALTTPWGEYSAEGKNQKIAKAKAAEAAIAAHLNS